MKIIFFEKIFFKNHIFVVVDFFLVLKNDCKIIWTYSIKKFAFCFDVFIIGKILTFKHKL
jgi:hypothetical protein